MKQNTDYVSGLLRLKRHEHPPEGYSEGFLQEFQKKQRAQLMRPSLRKAIMERISDLLPDFRIPSYAYAFSGAVAVAFSAWILTSEPIGISDSEPMASNADTQIRMELLSDPGSPLVHPVSIPNQRLVGSLPPHYSLENRPATKDEPFSF